MPIKDRDYKHEYRLQLKRGEKEERAQRHQARKAVDAAGIDRKDKHVAHVKAITNGGSNARSNLKVVAPRANLSFARRANHKPKV
jgi:hypothetical protein